MRKYFFFFLSVFSFQPLFAQQNIDWAKYDSLPFMEDTTIGFVSRDHFNKYYGITSDILKSEAIFELRVTAPPNSGERNMLVMRYYKDSTILEKFSGQYSLKELKEIKEHNDTSDKISFPKNLIQYITDNNGYYWQHCRKYLQTSEAAAIFRKLVENNLFVVNIQDKIKELENDLQNDPNYSKAMLETTRLEEGKIQHGPISNPLHVSFEVKFNHRFRTFNMNSILYYYVEKKCDEWKQRDIKQIEVGRDIYQHIASLY